MDPLTTAYLVFQGANTLFQAYGQSQQNAITARQYELQAQELMISGRENYLLAQEEISLITRTAAENARQVQLVGQQMLMQEEIAGKQRLGSIRARAGASGASVNVGTPANVQISQEFQNQYNQRMIDFNSRYEQARIRLEAKNQAVMKQRAAEIAYNQSMRKAEILRQSAGDVRGSRDMSLLGTLLGGAGQGILGYSQLSGPEPTTPAP